MEETGVGRKMGNANGLDSGCRGGRVEALEGASWWPRPAPLDLSTSDNLGQIILRPVRQGWGGMGKALQDVQQCLRPLPTKCSSALPTF